MSTIRLDKELEQYRNLMLPPSRFAEGFKWSSLAGAVFIALLMVPGAMYMGLLAGGGIGQAAQWVTVILFIEVARRAHKRLERPELFVLFYMASAAMASPFSGLLWNQFYVQSHAAHAMGVAQYIPNWVAPSDPAVLDRRSFMMWEWMPAIGLIVFGTFVGRLNNMILGYGLFRLASDIEKLPFPMAPINAQGITALAEQSQDEQGKTQESWRWRVFSIGGVLGLAFGAIYMGLPTITGALLNKPIVLLPIPFSDWTNRTQDVLQAVPMGLDWNLVNVVVGMVLPFFAMLGSFVAMLATVVANPILWRQGLLHSWQINQGALQTQYNNNIDFYFAFGIGTMAAIFLAGVYQVIRGLQARRRAEAGSIKAAVAQGPAGGGPSRGDIRLPFVIGTYLLTTLAYILLSGYLIHWNRNVMIVLVVFGFFYTPLISYVTARLEGMAGQSVEIPMVRETAFILSNYRGVDIWFLPVPLSNFGTTTVLYRSAELTGTRFWSLWKAEICLVPIVLAASIFFANFIWSLAPIPSAQYPFTEKTYEISAAQTALMQSSTLGHFSEFNKAFKWPVFISGTGVGVGLFAIFSALNLPVMFIYGVIRGITGMLPHSIIPQFAGALLGRYYFERKLGLKWRQYVPVVAAGFSCGFGLITVFCVGVTFLSKAVISLSY